MAQEQMRGVYVILCTPFDDLGNIDEESLRREVRFCLDAGVHGVVTTANASEFWTLSDDERKFVLRLVVGEIAGRVPVVAAVTSGSAWTSMMLAKDAEQAGADALMAMPPMTGSVPPHIAHEYYRMLAASVSIPVFIQNHEPPMGTKLSAEMAVRIVNDLDNVQYIKEETFPPGRAMSAELATGGAKLKGVMGGIGARHIFDEYSRGSCGTMPACQWADIHVRIWNALEAGDEATAREIFNRLLPVLNLESMLGVPLYKVILERRGLARSDYVRSQFGNPVDDHDRAELDKLMTGLLPYVRSHAPIAGGD